MAARVVVVTGAAAGTGRGINMTRTWDRELGRYGIRVNAVAPEMVKAMPENVGMVSRTPVGRLGKPRDSAEAYAWLAFPPAGFVHGSVLSVDGSLVIAT